jgi:subtilase family serine protease
MKPLIRLLAVFAPALVTLSLAATAMANSAPTCSGPLSCQTQFLTDNGHLVHPDLGDVLDPLSGTPAFIDRAYDLSYLSQTAGQGQTVAVVELGHIASAASDLAVFRTKFALPPCTVANGCFRQVAEDGSTNYPHPASKEWIEETDLDLDAVSTTCPNCHLLVVEAASAHPVDLAAADAQAAAQGAHYISDSWSITGRSARQALPGRFVFPDATVYAAAGDGSDLGSGINAYPAAITGVVAVGGTSLDPAREQLVAEPRGISEIPWLGIGDGSGTASGCDLTEPKPAWQHDHGCQGRTWVDISADGDPSTGLDTYNAINGWTRAGGTSLATPLVAGYAALLSVSGSAWPYHQHGLLFDPISGSDGSCSVIYLCFARPGYDAPTGEGTISGQVADGAASFANPGKSGYASNITPTSATLNAGVYANGEPTSYFWSYSSTTLGSATTPLTAAGSNRRLILTSTQLTGLTPGTTYHYSLSVSNTLGQATTTIQQFTTPQAARPVIVNLTNGPLLKITVACSQGLGSCRFRLWRQTPLTTRLPEQAQLMLVNEHPGQSRTLRLSPLAKGSIITAQVRFGHHYRTVSAAVVG